MAGFEVEIEALRLAGDAARSAGEQSAAVNVREPLAGISSALPGSASAPVAADTGVAIAARLDTASRAAINQGRDLGAAAAGYAANEASAQRDLVAWFGRWNLTP